MSLARPYRGRCRVGYLGWGEGVHGLANFYNGCTVGMAEELLTQRFLNVVLCGSVCLLARAPTTYAARTFHRRVPRWLAGSSDPANLTSDVVGVFFFSKNSDSG